MQNVLGSYRPETAYPANPFGTSLKNVAALIAGGMPTRVYFVSLHQRPDTTSQLVARAPTRGC